MLRNSAHFSYGDRLAIARAFRAQPQMLFAWIESFPPSERGDMFARALDDFDTTKIAWAPSFLEALPHETRHAEARRILGLREVRESEVLTLTTPPSCPSPKPASRWLQRWDGRRRRIGHVGTTC